MMRLRRNSLAISVLLLVAIASPAAYADERATVDLREPKGK